MENWRDVSNKQLVKEIILRRSSNLASLLELVEIKPLTEDQQNHLRNVICDELIEVGLGEEDAPTSYGLRLEDLIDYLAHV